MIKDMQTIKEKASPPISIILIIDRQIWYVCIDLHYLSSKLLFYHMCVCIYTHTHIYIYIYIYNYIYTHTYIHTYILVGDWKKFVCVNWWEEEAEGERRTHWT